MSEEKTNTVNGVIYRFSTSWIHSLETETHWRLYWRQQKMMQGLVLPDHDALEIGVGSGFTANYLRSKGINITTIDIDEDKDPDIVANIVTHDFQTSYDHILAFEVFEHIPFNKFEDLLVKIAHVCRQYMFLSVPFNERVWLRCQFKLPVLGERSIELTTRKGRITTPHHFWEVNWGGITTRYLEETFNKAGFRLVDREKAFSRWFCTLQSSP